MLKPSNRALRWARNGAILAAVLSLISAFLPAPWGFLPWDDAHLVLHNLSAVLVRITIFALIGGALGMMSHHLRRHRI